MVGFMCPEPIDSFCLLLRSSHEALRKRGRSRQALQSADGSSEMVVEELMPFGAAFDLQGQVCVSSSYWTVYKFFASQYQIYFVIYLVYLMIYLIYLMIYLIYFVIYLVYLMIYLIYFVIYLLGVLE